MSKLPEWPSRPTGRSDSIEVPREQAPRATSSREVLPALPFPPGLVGELASYFYESAIRPVPEVALTAALGLVAGIAGRQWNIAGEPSGLNLYLILLGETGIGKEGGKDGIHRLLRQVRTSVPAASEFVGPSVFASGQALMKRLAKQPCFFSMWGEFGQILRRITGPRATSAEQYLLQALLDVYSRSGKDKEIGETAYSDAEKNVAIVHAPSVTIIGDSTPDVFFECLDDAHIASGLVPRLLVIECAGTRPPRNPNAGAKSPPELVAKVAAFVETALRRQNGGEFTQVPHAPAGASLLDAFDAEADAIINEGSQAHRQAWNRAHLNALKVATTLGVGCNPADPVVTADHAEWATAYVRRSLRTVLRRFERGEIGGGDQAKAEAVILRRVREFMKMTPEQRSNPNLRIPETMRSINYLIPYAYLHEQTKRIQPFKDKGWLLKAALEDLVKSGVLIRLSPMEARVQCKTRGGDVYTLGLDFPK